MLKRIEAFLPTLSAAEQRGARLVIAAPRDFVKLTISDIAERAHVSKPTVVRFCQSLGYDGLIDFKVKLIGNASAGVPYIHPNVDVHDSVDDMLAKLIDNNVNAFLSYRTPGNTAALEQAAQVLLEAYRSNGRIEFYGIGNSGIVAQDAQHKFFRLGVNSTVHGDGHVQVMSASLRRPGDVVVIFSNSGCTRDLIDAADIAAHNGAQVLAVTASGSPLAGRAHVHLVADHPEGYGRYSPMTSRLLHLMIVDALATALAMRIGVDSLQPRLKDMKSNLHSRRYL